MFDFCRRIDLRKVNRRSLEALIRAGALDQLAPNRDVQDRSTLLATLSDAIQAAEQDARNAEAGMGDLFGGGVEAESVTEVAWQTARPWRDDVRLQGEKDTLGLFLTGHPIDQYEAELRHMVSSRINALQPTGKGELALIAGQVVQLRQTKSKQSGERLAFITLDDKTGRIEVSVFGEAYRQYGDLLQQDVVLIIRGGVRRRPQGDGEMVISVSADEIMDIRRAREQFARRLLVQVPVADGLPEQLRQLLTPYRGGNCPIMLQLAHPLGSGQMQLGDDWRVAPEEALLEDLRGRFGSQSVTLQY